MKKTIALLLSVSMIFALTACGSQNGGNNTANSQSGNEESGTAAADIEEEPAGDSEEQAEAVLSETEDTEAGDTGSAGGKTLVVYYSASGNTKEAANYIAAATGADLFELVPVEPYSDADLNWTDDNSRVVYEHDNPDAREVELEETTISDWESYDTVFIGYPIWWGIAAWPVDGFVTANDFAGKTVIPFCTSASSGLGESGELLAEMAGTGDWQEGMRFRSGVSEEDVRSWIDSLGL